MDQEANRGRLNQKYNFISSQDYNEISKKHQNADELFKDSEFVAGPNILTNDADFQTIKINYLGQTHIRHSEIEWLRPHVCIVQIVVII